MGVELREPYSSFQFSLVLSFNFKAHTTGRPLARPRSRGSVGFGAGDLGLNHGTGTSYSCDLGCVT